MATSFGNFKKIKDCRIIGVDNLSRRKWVKMLNCTSAIPIKSMYQRIKIAKKFGFKNINFIYGDLTDAHFTKDLFKKFDFDIVIRCASQPSTC